MNDADKTTKALIEPDTIRFTVDLSPEMHQRLSILAARLGKKKSVLVRRALAQPLLWRIAQLIADMEDDGLIR